MVDTTEEAKQNTGPLKVDFGKELANWLEPHARIAKLIPQGKIIGGSALILQLMARKPEILEEHPQLLNELGPNDIDIVCSSAELDQLKKRYPLIANKFFIKRDGYARKPAKMPDTYYLALSDSQSVPGRKIHIDVILESESGYPLISDEIYLGGVRTRVACPEELYLHRLFQLTGYERAGREDRIEAPKARHHLYLQLNEQIVNRNRLEKLFPQYKERISKTRGIDIREQSLAEFQQKYLSSRV